MLSTVTDMGFEESNPPGNRAGSSKLNMSSVIAEGRNEVPCEHVLISGPANSISQLSNISPSADFK